MGSSAGNCVRTAYSPPHSLCCCCCPLGARRGSRRSTSFFHQHASAALFRFQFSRPPPCLPVRGAFEKINLREKIPSPSAASPPTRASSSSPSTSSPTPTATATAPSTASHAPPHAHFTRTTSALSRRPSSPRTPRSCCKPPTRAPPPPCAMTTSPASASRRPARFRECDRREGALSLLGVCLSSRLCVGPGPLGRWWNTRRHDGRQPT